ncbi:MAG: hypothetical protein HYS27_02465 [Deltaproteobacteria bacterium]|nr:hypothetical protein [Deltaproteobacteria bacterium]
MSATDGMRVDVRDLVSRARRWVSARVGGATITTGFISFPLVANDPERTAARQLVIRLRDKRVFTASDCCDGCVKNSIAALQEVRKILVEAQVQLANSHGGQLFWCTDYMRETIRAFLTWEERVRAADRPDARAPDEHYRDQVQTRRYIEQLDVLRAHVRVAMTGIAKIAEMELPEHAKADDVIAAAPQHLLIDAGGPVAALAPADDELITDRGEGNES